MKRLGTNFFSDGLYDKVRHGYTEKLVPELRNIFPGKEPLVLAEFGAGSGAFTKIIIDAAGFAVEKLHIIDPDENGLSLHKEKFSSHSFHKKIIWICGTSENSLLPDNSIDGIFTAQAFHWFDIGKTRSEWLRITKPQSKIFILGRFNIPVNTATEEYIALTRFGKRPQGHKENIEAYSPEKLEFFFGHPVERRTLCREKESKTHDEFMGEMKIRINTSGSAQVIRQSNKIMEKARAFFEKHQINNCVELVSETFYVCDCFVPLV